MTQDALNDREAAAFLGLSKHTLRKYRMQGTGPIYYKIGGRVVYTVDDLRAYRETGRVSPRGC
jgi:predicted DNA-binding transcriptional regulator AlpA